MCAGRAPSARGQTRPTRTQAAFPCGPPGGSPLRSRAPTTTMSTRSARLAKNLAAVRSRIERACGRGGRDPAQVKLVAVTKSVGAAEAAELVRLGAPDLG